MFRRAFAAALLLALPVAAAPPAGVWIEGEAFTRGPETANRAGWGAAERLANAAWLTVVAEPDKVEAAIPTDGLKFAYDFDATAGPHAVWLRIGYEFARAPFRYRVNDGFWTDVTPDQLTTDLMAIADFCPVAWLNAGATELVAGKNTLEILVPRPAKGPKGYPRVLFGLDVIHLAASPFRPDGPHAPGSDWRSVADVDAGRDFFDFPKVVGPPNAGRRSVELAGPWQFARDDEPGDVQDRTSPMELPKDLAALPWRAIAVPADRDAARPEYAYCHRYLYRAKVNVPKSMSGRSFVLRFPNNALLTTVFVNGKRVGFSKTPCAAFDCDCTAAIKPGELNEIVVGIKDLYYALARTAEGKSCRHLFDYPPDRFHNGGGLGPTRFADFPVLFKVRRNGILEAPTLTAAGPVYVSDVFCIPSVARKTLDLEVTVRNPAAEAKTVEVSAVARGAAPGSPASWSAGPQAVMVPAGGSAVVKLSKPWESPRLWWPDDPAMYAAEVTVGVNGVAFDTVSQPFGFREWGIKGNQFTLNGIPWHFRADLRHNDLKPDDDPAAAVREWKKNGQTAMRFWGDKPWTGKTQQATLDFFDAAGVPVRRTSTFDGEVASYLLVQDGQVNQPLFDNWFAQLEAWVRSERNHPCLHVWSLENEVTYINARNFGWLRQVEPQMKRAAEIVQRLDPTRPVMLDGGDATMDASLPVYGNHYLEGAKRDYPDEAYTLKKAYTHGTVPGQGNPWPIRNDKPLYLGESFFANGSPPAAYAEVSGESAFLGRREAARGVARFARMLSEGYRWHGVAGFHFWFAEGPDAEHYAAWQPVCALVREWDSCWPAGAKVARTVKVFNDTRHASPITLHWLLQTPTGGSQHRGSREFRIPPGEAEEFTLELPTPNVPADLPMEFVLACYRDGKEVFRDVKPVRVVCPPARVNAPIAAVALFDPANKVGETLKALTAFTPVADWKALPDGCNLLVVAPDAVPAKDATNPAWADLVRRGVRVLVLNQAHPLNHLAVPAEVDPTAYSGSIAFPENMSHPAFAGLVESDFFGRPAGGRVYRNAYRKPGKGARSLLQCDRELSCSALVECGHGNGLMLLCQVPTDDTPGGRLLANLVGYALNYAPAAKPTAVAMAEADPRVKLFRDAGLKFSLAPNAVAALKGTGIVVVDATPAALTELVAAQQTVRDFTAAGGTLMLWGVTPEGLKSFNTLVGFDHAIRPFRMERVRLPATRDPLLAGLTLRDVALESAEKINPWAGDRYPAKDTFTHVVDLDDAAPFATSKEFAHGWSQMTNGLTSADNWKFVFYHDQGQAGERPSWSATLAKEEEITGLSIIVNAHYRTITKLRIVFDGNESETVTLKPEAELKQDFTFAAPHKCRTVALEPLDWTPHAKPVVGVDNLWLTVKRPADFAQRVVPLLNIGALVKYPQGKGMILLNEVAVPATEANPENAEKKRALVATLLRNAGAEFAADKLILPGFNLAYTPVPLGDKCNGYLASDKRMFAGQPDLSLIPVGEQKFAGVRYDLRDFNTSPLPGLVTLAGAEGVTANEVAGVPVGKTADAVFFLHGFHPAKPWQAKADTDPPVVFEYVVTYKGGATATVPVRLGKEVVGWNQAMISVPDLPGAAVAWHGLPGSRSGAVKSAVLYAMRWVNPRPGEVIESLAVRYPNKTPTGYGVPVVFAVTLADEKK